ncbi:MAG TPA: nodulation protein NfeD [Candidatus Limnocylindrales bacterium]|nr:nodulation protein NfeD [Candidatus Limnocylindrales bacterium]
MTTSRRTTRFRLARVLAALGLLLLAAAGAVRGAEDRVVVVLTANGVVDPVLAGYLEEGIAGAAADGAEAVVVELNTPGGSLDATGRITSAFLEADVPVIVWVAPQGARAASAGTFITLAAHLAYMAPGTNIGAAAPVDSSGGDIEGTMGDKVRNDTIANITAIAEARGRPVDWAVSTVEEAKSYPASAAVEAGAVDGIAATIDEVLEQADGREVVVDGVPRTLATAGATVDEAPMNPLQGFLHLLSDPNVAFVLFTIGLYGLIFELQNPNFVTGILGAIALLLAFIGFGSLPLNLAGVLLIGLGVLLFVLEAQVVSHGLLAIGGIICFVLGASALYTEPGGDPMQAGVEVATPVILVATVTTGALMAFITIAAIRTRRMRAPKGTVGVPVPLGSAGIVQAPLAPLGTVHLAGETWSARTPDERPLERDTPVRLVGFDGLVAIVEPLEPGHEPPSPVPPAPLPADMP